MGINDRKRRHLVIGLDFGTTYTGVAYAFSGDRRIFTVNQWPGPEPGSLVNEKQVPSVLAYEDEKHFWGYQVTPEMRNSYSFMKLHLDKNAPPAEYDRKSHGENLKSGYFQLPEAADVKAVTRKFLVRVLAYTRLFLEKKFKKVILEATRVEFWITKPIASGDEAQHVVAKLAKEAATEAGFAEELARAAGFADNGAQNFFGLVEESVAGLTANLRETIVSPKDEVKPGDKILVCDCGGGQVDIAVYKLGLIKDTLELKQITVAQGPKVGGAHIDRRLHELMAKNYSQFNDLGPLKQTGSQFMQDFENHKRAFGKESSGLPITLRLDMRDAKKSRLYKPDGRVVLEAQHMERLFKSTVNQIKKSASEQLDKANKLPGGNVKSLALVGGLGDSPYLRSVLQEWCRLNNDITLRTVDDSWNAVAKGAVAYGLGIARVTKRLTQNHYGIGCVLKFDPTTDGMDEIYYFRSDAERKKPYCRNCVSWIVNMFLVSIYCSKAEKAPRKVNDSTNRANAITVTLKQDDLSKATYTKGYIRYPWKLEVLVGEREGTVIFQVRSGKRVLGSEVVNFSTT